jgi:hypothetical protein
MREGSDQTVTNHLTFPEPKLYLTVMTEIV